MTRPNETVKRIADELRATPELLALTTKALTGDVCARYGVGYATAWSAVLLAKSD